MKSTLFAWGLAGIATIACAATAAAPSYVIDTIAGSSAVGDGGMAIAAALGDAQGIAIDRAGNIYISDTLDNRVRRISPSGVISTVAGNGFAGSGGDGGPAAAAQLSSPYGLAADNAGNLYIADLGNNRIRKVTPDGAIATLAVNDNLQTPRNVAVDAAGYIYVSEFDAQRVRKISPGGAVSLVAGSGERGFQGDGGPATAASLSYPTGLALDRAGRLYIADSGNNRIRRVDGGRINTVLDASSTAAGALATPTGVAVDSGGNLYIADSGNHRIRRLTPAGAMSSIPVDGRDASFDSGDNLYIAGGTRAMKVTAAGAIFTLAGDGSYGFRGDGAAAGGARLSGPAGMALSAAGELFFADQNNRRIRKISSFGVIDTVTAAGGPQLQAPNAVAFDPSQRLYMADPALDEVLRMEQPGRLSIVTGLGVPAFLGDGGPAKAAGLSFPTNLAFDIQGSLYIADTANHRVRKVSSGGFISTVAGNGARGYNGDGQPAASSQLDTPNGIIVDNAGNLYIADSGNQRIRKVTPAGDISTVAGTGGAKFSGDEGPAVRAALNWPRGVAMDAQGNLFIADSLNNRVRMITADGAIHTIAGDGSPYFGGDGGPATAAHLNAPVAIAVDGAGAIFVSDRGNNRIRKLTLSSVIAPLSTILESDTKVTVVQSATLLPGPVAAGELISIFAAGIGIGDGNPFGDTKVYFDGDRGDLFYAQPYQVNVQVPYSVVGKSVTEMEILVKGVSLGKTALTVVDAAPGIFTVNGSGTGPAAATNQDGAANSETNPAARGSVVILYGTGEGQTAPAGQSATPAADPLPKPVLPVRLSIGGVRAEILYAGAAPGLVGALQINFRMPVELVASGALPVSLQIGNSGSQLGVTIAVQ